MSFSFPKAVGKVQHGLAATVPFQRADLLVLGGYLLLSVYLVARVLPHFSSAIPGGAVAGADGWQNVWNLWWVREAVVQRSNPFTTTMLFHPTGVELYGQTLNVTNGILTLPVQLLAGPIAAYNVAVLLGLLLSGYGAYLVARYVLGDRRIAAVVGGLFTFSPFHLAKLWDGQLEWITLQWVPLYILFLLRALETRRLRDAVLAGVSAALIALTSWYCAIFALVWTALLVLVRLPGVLRSAAWREEAALLAVIGSVSAILLSPVLIPVLRQHGDAPSWGDSALAHSADLLDLVAPSNLHPLWGAVVTEWNAALRPGIWGWNVTPGIALLLLAAIGCWMAWPVARRWLLLAALPLLLALGPELQIAGQRTGLPLPYALLAQLPGMALARRPNHFVLVALLPLALLAGLGMRSLLARGGRGRAALALLGGLLIAEYAVLPPPAVPFAVAPVYAALRDQPGAVVELPLHIESAAPLRHQLVHGRPIVGGFVARTPDYPFVSETPGMQELWALEAQPETNDILVDRVDRRRQALSFYGLTTFVLHHAGAEPVLEQRARTIFEQFFPTAARQYEDQTITVYNLPPLAEPRAFAYLSGGWQPLEYNDHAVWRWIGETAELTLVNPASETRAVALDLAVESFERPRPLTLLLDEQPLATLEVSVAARSVRLWFDLAPGEHRLQLVSAASPLPADRSRAISLSFTRIELIDAPN